MLVLGRNLNETIVIDGKIFIKIVRGKLGNGLKVAIEAPRDRGDGGKVGPGIGSGAVAALRNPAQETPGIPPKIPPAREDAAGFCPSPVCAQCGGGWK